eukprot:TRINITY_DN8524_c0_g1_i1.p1 TRINITY_DN8524_c0_g1~~TRINITY_DN8524_c0_g1_i1.p1  ORF type:complete len:295 (-),score=65.30 TRINITY_DN8524_c0_g1_i1:95-868(-)
MGRVACLAGDAAAVRALLVHLAREWRAPRGSRAAALWLRLLLRVGRAHLLDLRAHFNANAVLRAGVPPAPEAVAGDGIGCAYYFALGAPPEGPALPLSGLFTGCERLAPALMGWAFSDTRNALIFTSSACTATLRPRDALHASAFPAEARTVAVLCTLGCNHAGTPFAVTLRTAGGNEYRYKHTIPDWNGFCYGVDAEPFCTGPRMQPGGQPDSFPWTIFQATSRLPQNAGRLEEITLAVPEFAGGYLAIFAVTLMA